MSWVEERERYQAIATEVEPAAVLVTKDHWLWSAMWWAATILTLGLFALGMKKSTFLDVLATTFFPIQGYPSRFPKLSTRLIVHECRHTTHCVWLGYLVPIVGWIPGRTGRHIRAWCGAPTYTFLYLIFLIPTVFAVGRWLIELDADRAAWRWQLQHGYKISQILQRAESFGGVVCSGRYFWAWLRCLGGVTLYQWAARRIVNEHT